MPESNLMRLAGCLASALLLAHCGHNSGNSGPCAGTSGCSTASPSGGAGGAPSAGASSRGGTSAAGASSGGVLAVAGASSSGGAPSAGGSSSGAGTTSSGGASPAGGAASLGGASGNGGSIALGGASTSQGGTPASGGGSSQGGALASGGLSAAGGAPVVDKNGVPLARPGDSKTGSREYLNFGDFRLLLNKWGSDELGCKTTMKVFSNTDKSFGWSFDRGACGGNKSKPDYPEIEFGIHPFGASSNLATSPSFSSTTILPLQIKDIKSAAVIVDGLNVSMQRATTWNVDFEFWLSQRNPVTDPNPGVYAELIAFWGWQDTWACDKSGSVSAGDKSYNLCHQSDSWGSGWRYYQLRASSGSSQSFSGKVDVKALLDWLVNTYKFSPDLWVTRFEVGTELDDNTAGSVTLKNITFQVNGTSKSAQFAQ